MDNAIVVLPPKYDDIDIIYQYLTNKELSVIATTVLSHVNEAHLLWNEEDGHIVHVMVF